MDLPRRDKMEGVVADWKRGEINVMLPATMLKKEDLVVIMPMRRGEVVAVLAAIQGHEPEGEVKVIATGKVIRRDGVLCTCCHCGKWRAGAAADGWDNTVGIILYAINPSTIRKLPAAGLAETLLLGKCCLCGSKRFVASPNRTAAMMRAPAEALNRLAESAASATFILLYQRSI